MARAHGKVILLGEHVVVYGAPAIAAGLDRGASATARRAPSSRLVVGSKSFAPGDGTDLGRALSELVAALGAGPHEIEAETDLPLGVGLGSSAALGVACARAVAEALRREAVLEAPRREVVPEGVSQQADDDRVLAAALEWERVFHGNPSGIDTEAAIRGGCFWFVRGEPAVPIRVPRPLQLAIAVAGPPASTKSMVDGVARLRERRPEVFQKTLEGIRSLVKNARLALEVGDLPGLGRLMDLNQMLLAGLLVSTEGIERACRLARGAGALGAKLTGAGGGGSVIALCDEETDGVLAVWREAGLECFAATVTERDSSEQERSRRERSEGEGSST